MAVPANPHDHLAAGRVTPGPTRARSLPEGGHARGVLTDDPRVVEIGCAGGLAAHQHHRARPHGQTRAASAAFLVAHCAAPLGAVDISVNIAKWRHHTA